jgi:transposase-like protein
MSQHFLLSRTAKSLTLAQVFRMTDAEAEAMLRRIRWPDAGDPVCSHCGSLTNYECRRPSGAPRWRCKDCGKDFSITSGTLFASHKLPLRGYLAAIAIFCNEVKGKSMLAMSRDLGLSYKSSFVLAHKLRKAMSEEMKGRVIGDDRPEAEVDGAYFGGHIRPANLVENRKDRRLARHQTGKRKVVVVIRERVGETLPGVFKSEGAALSWIRHRVARAPCCTPTRRRPGTICTRVSRCAASITKRPTASMAPRPIGLSPTSHGCAVARLATITTSPARICCASHKRRRGARTTAASPTAIRCGASPSWR